MRVLLVEDERPALPWPVRGSPMFGVLAAPVLEGLARSLTPVRFAAGDEVVREGEPA